jgi:hypothetical protein
MIAVRAAVLGMVLVGPASACRTGDVRFATRFSPDFVVAHRTVSILGVYKDGRMSSEAWGAIASRISPSLGAAGCEAAFANERMPGNPVLWAAIDDYARANGPTDDLLTQLAPAARGDHILVLTFAGKPPTREKYSLASEAARPQGRAGAQGGARGGMRRATAQPANSDMIDMTASLFSVAHGRSVALVTMQYSGASVDDAIARFAEKLAESLPETKCTGWIWEATVDPERIRRSIDP